MEAGTWRNTFSPWDLWTGTPHVTIKCLLYVGRNQKSNLNLDKISRLAFFYSTYPEGTYVWRSQHVPCIPYICVIRAFCKGKRNFLTMRHMCACINDSPNVRLLFLQQPEEQEGLTVLWNYSPTATQEPCLNNRNRERHEVFEMVLTSKYLEQTWEYIFLIFT